MTDTKQTQPSRFRFRAHVKVARQVWPVIVLGPADNVVLGSPVPQIRLLEEVDLMQSTGLTDCDGTEIFEGDVFSCCGDFVVEWSAKKNGFVMRDADTGKRAAIAGTEKNGFVAGNIYAPEFAHLRPEPTP